VTFNYITIIGQKSSAGGEIWEKMGAKQITSKIVKTRGHGRTHPQAKYTELIETLHCIVLQVFGNLEEKLNLEVGISNLKVAIWKKHLKSSSHRLVGLWLKKLVGKNLRIKE